MQHYGIRTTWIDLVDNIWVALWFSLMDCYSESGGAFLHFDPRRPAENEFGYILLVSVEESGKGRRKGFLLGRRTETVDLRVAAPSIFIRPHAQHGLLFRPIAASPQSDGAVRPLDYSSFIRGIVRFSVEDGIRWLGTGEAHSVRGLFPPPFYDSGYKILLNSGLRSGSLGGISHVGA